MRKDTNADQVKTRIEPTEEQRREDRKTTAQKADADLWAVQRHTQFATSA
ncbi:hypothetical protein [Acidimangrovimonas sediminis]|nr:hypothetical protein [Acidimangrovimonas sediminis]